VGDGEPAAPGGEEAAARVGGRQRPREEGATAREEGAAARVGGRRRPREEVAGGAPRREEGGG
jgi:hypothetical protein